MNNSIINSFSNYAYFLTDRWGEFIGRNTPEGEAIRLRQIMLDRYSGQCPFDTLKQQYMFVEGDPRRYMPDGELSFIVIRNDRLGILIEGELDATAGDESSDGLTRDRTGSLVVSPSRLLEMANHWLEKLAPLKSQFPHTEFFVSHGEVAFDGRLQINAFTSFQERDEKFYSPYEDEQAIEKIEKEFFDLLYPKCRSEAYRIYTQLVMAPVGIAPVESLLKAAVGESRAADVLKQGDREMIDTLVRKHGAHETCALLNQVLGSSINIGDYVLASISENGMWCNDFGWTDNRDAATGFDEATVKSGVSMVAVLDAEFVKYDDVDQYFAVNQQAA